MKKFYKRPTAFFCLFNASDLLVVESTVIDVGSIFNMGEENGMWE